MANKKLQNNQNGNKKNETSMTNGTTSSTASASGGGQNANTTTSAVTTNNSSSQQPPPSSQQNNNATTPTPSVTSTTPSVAHAPPTQRLSTSSNQSKDGGPKQQQQTTVKKQHDLDKTVTNSSTNQAYRGGGAKDQRAREKENVYRNNYRNNTQQHHQMSNQGNGAQNNRKKEGNKFQNRDHSSQSHRGGHNNYNAHQTNVVVVQQQLKPTDISELAKPIGFPPAQLQAPPPTAPVAPAPTTAPAPVAPVAPVVHEKLVQTEPMEEKKKRKEKVEEKEKTVDDVVAFRKTGNKKLSDTVFAFSEHDTFDRVDLMCELLELMDQSDLHLLSNCIESKIRSYTNQMRPVEKMSNCAEPTASFPPYIIAPPFQNPVANFYPGMADCGAAAIQRQYINLTFNSPMTQPPPGLPPIATGAQLPTVYSEGPSSSGSSSNKEIPNAQQNGSATSSSPPTTATTTPSEGGDEKIINTSVPPPRSAQDGVTTSDSTASDALTSLCRQSESDNAQFVKSIKEVLNYLYVLVSVCASTNRKSAAKIADYVVTVMMRERPQIMERITKTLDRIAVTQDYGKLMSGIIHHPATTLDTKLKFTEYRETLRPELDNLLRVYYTEQLEQSRRMEPTEHGVGRELEEGEQESEDEELLDEMPFADSRSRLTSLNHQFGSSSSSAPPPSSFFVTRFIGKPVEKNDNAFVIEIHWSDGDRTFTQRTRDQLKAFQHRLLDEFGQQRTEKATMSTSSFDDENKKLSTSTSTMETNFGMSGERIVPRLARDASSAQFVQYINELSDLPARVMLSAVICEEFNGTRAKTDDLLQESSESADGLIYTRWKNPRSKSPVRYFERPPAMLAEPVSLPITMVPFTYSNIGRGQLQTIYPSCSNCGGHHQIKNCKKSTILERKTGSEQKIRGNGNGASSSSSSGGPTSSNSQMHGRQMSHAGANGWRTDLEAAPIQLNAHFSHHQQQQQMLQNSMFHQNAAPQFRVMPQYEGVGQQIFLTAPPPSTVIPQQATPTNGASN